MLRNQSAALAISFAIAGAPAAAPKVGVNRARRGEAPTIVRVTTPDGGFDWRDAGIGAAGGFAVSMIGIGGALVASGRGAHHEESLPLRSRRRSTHTRRG
jgi:hypothetical protein